ncbi:dethiobiotin synthase [Corynebacterium sp.]|uniref:dethiobiotin synthase n=1 Tax=Corynebacterium sp. TaxID=1720 RepID=UPI002A91953E|nr:dethiobiotin synthase [Corynebacterium sp.]MDY5785821.1 dethiobiotin synthase [Corynebacterium sp.]
MTRYVVVSGTGTEIGKTVVTAALAALLQAHGARVGIAKPIQTGLHPGEKGDCDLAAELAGIDASFEYRRLREPLAPETAARRAGVEQATAEELADAIRAWAPGELDLVLVEGAGGVLARLGTDVTIVDVAHALQAPVVLVTQSGLGTLSNTELATNHLRDAGVACAGLVIGDWPSSPDLAQRCNAEDLPRLTGVALVGRIPSGVGRLGPGEIVRGVGQWFDPALARTLLGWASTSES